MQSGIFKLLIPLVVILAAVAFGRFVVETNTFVLIGVVLALAAAAATFLNPENGIILLTFSMLLSPEIVLARAGGRPVTVRMDDFLLIAVFLAFVAYHAVSTKSRFYTKTPIDRPLLAMIVIYFVSTGLGILDDARLKPLNSFFFALKYVQYFILFWMTANVVSSYDTLKKVVIAGTITTIVVCIYAYFLMPTADRVYAPFDMDRGSIKQAGEPGTLGGYLLIPLSLALSFFMNHDSKKVRYFALALFLFALPPFVKTLSRASYVALIVGIIPALLLLSPRRKLSLVIIALLGLVSAPLVAPSLTRTVTERYQFTFSGPTDYRNPVAGNMHLEASAATRVVSWKVALTEWLPRKPFLGHGATGVGLVDTQYPRILGEFGLVGFAVFFWLIFAIFRNSYRALRSTADPFEQSLAIGFIAALVGLLVQSLGVNTFIIVRIMTPFWLLCALVMSIPLSSKESLRTPDELPRPFHV